MQPRTTELEQWKRGGVVVQNPLLCARFRRVHVAAVWEATVDIQAKNMVVIGGLNFNIVNI